MGTEDIPLLLSLFVLILLSSYFSGTEMAFSAASRIRLKGLAGNGEKRAELALKILEQYDKFLTTALIGNNLVNIAATTIATILCIRLWGDVGATVSTVAMTILVLIFGEITPKTAAKRSPERYAMSSARSMWALMIVLTPLSFLFSQWQKYLSRKGHEETAITEAELLTIVEESRQEGALDDNEGELIRSAIEFNDLQASDILTPRVAVEAVDIEDGAEEIEKVFLESGFSRLPIYRKSIDNILGVITQKDYFANARAENKPPEELIKPVSFVPEVMPVSTLLKLLQNSKTHLAVVTDEYGGTLGIVTMEDILEELVGEIYDEHDDAEEETDIALIGEDEYKISGSAHLEELTTLINIPEEDVEEFATVNGWIADKLNKIPEEGDYYTDEGYEITVTDADERKANELILKRIPKQETEDE
ncbi:MAG TPA: hemolysin family protein [Oscillospiraceae bacterium]|nr:hemolysin family protein [Oscillospiraceae bacterium]HPF55990.1 hemolysin family protein [Clostridiales bacterium]HPK36216.1 hemolysin family protein [Oscillospiraceae bacterium]HPR75707.1 hemolysin family protein [Oscillospiraceae bacterium]